MRWVSSGECRNSCWAAAEALAGTEAIDPEKVRGRNSGPVIATEMRRRCRDWNECDQRDRVLSDRARRATDCSSIALAHWHIRSVGDATAPARIADRFRSPLGGSSLNSGSRNRSLMHRDTAVRGKRELCKHWWADELGRSSSRSRDSHRGSRCDSCVHHNEIRGRSERGAHVDHVHNRSAAQMRRPSSERSRQQEVR